MTVPLEAATRRASGASRWPSEVGGPRADLVPGESHRCQGLMSPSAMSRSSSNTKMAARRHHFDEVVTALRGWRFPACLVLEDFSRRRLRALDAGGKHGFLGAERRQQDLRGSAPLPGGRRSGRPQPLPGRSPVRVGPSRVGRPAGRRRSGSGRQACGVREVPVARCVTPMCDKTVCDALEPHQCYTRRLVAHRRHTTPASPGRRPDGRRPGSSG